MPGKDSVVDANVAGFVECNLQLRCGGQNPGQHTLLVFIA